MVNKVTFVGYRGWTIAPVALLDTPMPQTVTVGYQAKEMMPSKDWY